MYISRIVIRNFRNFSHLDVRVKKGVTCIVGENNTGKTNLLHAIRLAIDSDLSSTYRNLLEHDIHRGVSFSTPNQVVISIELADYQDSVTENALAGCCEVAPNLARINYRYRPRTKVREEIEASESEPENLSLASDYHFEITGGGEKDPATVTWDEDLGDSLRFADLQSFKIEFLPALRDVQQSLRQSYTSPLSRLLSVSEITDEDKDALVSILRSANQQIESQPTISATGQAIERSFASSVGEAFKMNLRLGIVDPSFTSLSRSLTILLSNGSLTDFDPGRNGLGLNNILYISMLTDYFEKRVGSTSAAGQLLIIEEPEAHLHPQLQRVLYTTLAGKEFQTFISTHSTHISSHAPVDSYIVLTNQGMPATSGCVPTTAANLGPDEVADLNRFLDATRSTLLYARKVILVEGAAELFLIPALIKQVMKIDLDRFGVSIVPIFGTHFEVYAKLFGPNALRKKCAIICDGDQAPNTLGEMDEDDALEDNSLSELENEFVQVYQCPVTFERAAAIKNGTLRMFELALAECEYTKAQRAVRAAIRCSKSDADFPNVLSTARQQILRSAVRCGKARFAQIASKYATKAKKLPWYIEAAVKWLLEEELNATNNRAT